MYIYICVCIYIYVCVCIYIYIYIYIYTIIIRPETVLRPLRIISFRCSNFFDKTVTQPNIFVGSINSEYSKNLSG